MPQQTADRRVAARRQQSLERKRQALSKTAGNVEVIPQTQSLASGALRQALPHELVAKGLIAFDSGQQPKIAEYDPTLLAPNPQRGRLVHHNLEEKAKSLSADGQQQPIVARLILPEDRADFGDAFTDEQRLLILIGHSVFYAQPKSNLSKLAVELMLPEVGEDATAYRR